MITIEHQPELHMEGDRRRHQRLNIQRPVKLFDPNSGKYHLGSTCDLSVSGVLIELTHAIGVRPGDEILLGIAQKRRQPLLRHDDMVRAKVVRTISTVGGRMLLAAEFPPGAALPLGEQRFAA
jgi:hypothetical protein